MHAYIFPDLSPGPALDRADPADRYAAVVRWAAWRYSDQYGRLVVSEGGKPTKYTRIEEAAFRRFMAATEPTTEG